MAARGNENYTQFVKQLSAELGFSYCGISTATELTEEAHQLEKWLSKGMHGAMGYMAEHFDKRIDPRKLVPGARAVISLMYNYYPEKTLDAEGNYHISKYAYGEDYHTVIKEILYQLLERLKENIGDINARVFVDSAPVLEKAWAKRSGIGWQGKNTNIIHPKSGSFFFLAEIISDLDLIPDGPIKDHCGTCTACIDACPTEALTPYHIDATKCISYLTIELRDAIPLSFAGKMNDWMYGCDICQDVCPWNRFSKHHQQERFLPSDDLQQMQKSDWQEITEDIYRKLFKGSAVKRAKFVGLKRNIAFLNGE